MSTEQQNMKNETEEKDTIEEVVVPTTEQKPKEPNAAMPPPKLDAPEESRMRYPPTHPMAGRPMGGHSAFLQKRLAKGQKYFDSGDYQMARQSNQFDKSRMPPLLAQPTGETIPTPDSVPVRKTSIIQQTKLTSAS